MALLLATLLSVFATASAASPGDQNQVTWASVVFTYHGEKIPFFHDPPYSLTPLGANQLLQAGQAIRSHYISPPSNGSQSTLASPINGISVNDIDNDQIEILSTDDAYVSASALAFVQGLYPPGGTASPEESFMANGSSLQFPLGGYQYPNIQTTGTSDFNYIWIAGNAECTNFSINEAEILETSNFTSQMEANEDLYQNLTSSLFGNLNPSVVNYGNAADLYEYALFEYNHNKSVSDSLSAATLDQLHSLASAQQRGFNTANGGNTIGTIAGRTVASKVFQQLSESIISGGTSDKLTVLFGSFEPLLSFFDISGLSTGPSASMFKTLPPHGSLMAFELFSYTSTPAGQNLSTPFPSASDLWVRFLFRNGTDDNAPLVAYPLFGAGNSEVDMTWLQFANGIEGFNLNNVEDWCTACQTDTLFCQALALDDSNYTLVKTKHGASKLSPAIAGVIGATVTLAVFVLLSAVVGLLGFRVEHREKNANGKHGDLAVLRRSGGFKGAEKLASDTDLAIKNKAGATVVRHERVGSWELKDGPTSLDRVSSLDKEIESGRGTSKPDYGRRSEDGIGNVNPFGEPVSPIDHV